MSVCGAVGWTSKPCDEPVLAEVEPTGNPVVEDPVGPDALPPLPLVVAAVVVEVAFVPPFPVEEVVTVL